MDEAIDAVYTWVDGRDPAFQEQLGRLRPHTSGDSHSLDGARFHDNGELRFSLRSLELFAPWIRKVHIVTNGQVPSWIDRGHPRLSLSRHEDLFADRSVLPVFNSWAIEWQLFRIPGLSRRFLYFNDDFFLGRPVVPADFMTPDGGYQVFVESYDILSDQAACNDSDRALAFTTDMINARFGSGCPRKKIAHVPRLLDREILEGIHRLWPEEIRRTAGQRFRDPESVSLETLYAYYLLECPERKGLDRPNVVTSIPTYYTFATLGSPLWRAWKRLLGIVYRRPRFFCLNDDTHNASRADRVLIRMGARAALKGLFWRPSSFEARRDR
jgi:hypothetical protein